MSEQNQPPNGPVPVPKIDLAAIMGMVATKGWKDKRLWAILSFPLLVIANNKWRLGLTEGQLEYYAGALSAYVVASAGKAALIGAQYLKWFQQGGKPPEVVGVEPAKPKSGVVGRVLPALFVALAISLAWPGTASAEQSVVFGTDASELKEGVAPEPPSVADYFKLGLGVGADFRGGLAGGKTPKLSLQVVGMVGLYRLWGLGPVVSGVVGGEVLAVEGAGGGFAGAALLGVGVTLPGAPAEKPVVPSLFVAYAWHPALDGVSAGGSLVLGLGVQAF